MEIWKNLLPRYSKFNCEFLRFAVSSGIAILMKTKKFREVYNGENTYSWRAMIDV